MQPRSLLRAPWLFLLTLTASCIDPAALAGFDCDDAGRCTLPEALRDGGSAGGGSALGGGSAGGGGGASSTGGGDAGAGGGAAACSVATCTGCCDGTGTCVTGDASASCGQGGVTCAACDSLSHCQAGLCQPLTSNGGSCAASGDCASGFCVGHLCCTSACQGACETCSASGTEGHCSPLQEASNSPACGAYACDGVNGSCPTTCTTTRQCATGKFCNNGTCEPLRTTGSVCGSSAQCSSGFCADGYCCNQACSGSCDRCNLAGLEGTCKPAPANDPGSPLCGGSVVCNGSLPDCPILCTSGCPADTFCNPNKYCAAKKPPGTTCGAAGECLSGFCADGVCCTSACGGDCDACSVAAGAAVDGQCGLLGRSRVCRAASSTCDVEERCDGLSPTCGGNLFADAGVACGTTSFTAWSGCDGGAACATSGTQTRARTDLKCTGTGSCGTATNTESQSCARTTEGNVCGVTTYSAYTACNYAASCSTTGSRTRVRTDPLCASAACSAAQTTETDTAGCTRTTENLSCGTATYGAYGACSFATTCAEAGSRSRTRTDPVCLSSSCGAATATETDTAGCPRTTAGQSCGTTSTGTYGACSYGAACATSGSRTRTDTSYSCGSGACNSATNTVTDTAGCARVTTGQSCGTAVTGAWSACSYGATCSVSGSRTRSVTTYACDGAGGCAANAGSESDTSGCGRATDGLSCSPTTYGAYGACSYGTECTNSGSRTRAVTTYTCGAGACNGAGSTDTDVAGCARNTTGALCGAAPVCGKNSACDADCAITRACTDTICSAEVCTPSSYTETVCMKPACCLSCTPK